MNDLLAALQPYASVISALAGLAGLGFLIQLLNLVRNAMSEQIAAVREQKKVIEEQKCVAEARLKKAEEDLDRTEKWHQRQLEEQEKKLAEVLASQSITVEHLIAEGGHPDVTDEIRNAIGSVLQEISRIKEALPRQTRSDPDQASVLLNMAKGFAIEEEWAQAAEFFGRYLESDPENWEVHFLRGVAYGNARGGIETNRRALVSLSSAIAYLPPNLDENTKARVLGYRGADFKRLGRLQEAESDLLLARKYATARYELEDTAYNLAGIYAMMNRRADMLQYLRPLATQPRWRDYIRGRREYFSNYWEDEEFRSLIGL